MASPEAEAAGLEIISISTDTEEKYAPETAPLLIDAPFDEGADEEGEGSGAARAAATALRAAVAERLIYYTSYPLVPPRSVVDHLDSFGASVRELVLASRGQNCAGVW